MGWEVKKYTPDLEIQGGHVWKLIGFEWFQQILKPES